MKYSVAEFFCGCGGFSRGFSNSRRFEIVLGNDVKREALRTFRFNHRTGDSDPCIIRGDLRTVPLERIREALETKGVSHGNLDCLVGGPPCQGFSQLHRNEERANGKIVKFRGYNKLAEDPRNDLVLSFIEIAEYLKPKFIVIENVPQMLSHSHAGRLGKLANTVVEMLENEMGYSVAVRVMNAADYGVPQLRERAVFLASALGHATLPEPTHAETPSRDLFSKCKLRWNSVADAIQDLPEPPLGRDALGGGSTDLYSREASPYARQLRSRTAFPFNHISRSYQNRILKIIEEMQPGETWDAASDRMRSHYESVVRSMHSDLNRPDIQKNLVNEGLINPVFYKRYYWSAYTRLAWDLPALTITANANFLGSGRFTHPTAMRGITMREAARLQSFDDDFRFITSDRDDFDTRHIGVGMDMIGEAVPPLLGQAIAEHIATLLDSKSTITNQTGETGRRKGAHSN